MKNGSNQSDQETTIKVCSMCGTADGDHWQTRPTRPVALRLCPRYGDITQFWIICDECDEGLRSLNRQLQHTVLPKPDQIYLLTQIRRGTIQDQEAVLNWLLQKFNLEAKKRNKDKN